MTDNNITTIITPDSMYPIILNPEYKLTHISNYYIDYTDRETGDIYRLQTEFITKDNREVIDRLIKMNQSSPILLYPRSVHTFRKFLSYDEIDIAVWDGMFNYYILDTAFEYISIWVHFDILNKDSNSKYNWIFMVKKIKVEYLIEPKYYL